MTLVEAANYYLDNYAIVQNGQIVDCIARGKDFFVESAETDFIQLDAGMAAFHGLYRAVNAITASQIEIDNDIIIYDVYNGMDIKIVPSYRAIGGASYNIKDDSITFPCLDILDYKEKCESYESHKSFKKLVATYLRKTILNFMKTYRTTVVHELIHKNDNDHHKIPLKLAPEYGSPDYYNNGMEFNAYFLSTVYAVFATLKQHNQLKAYEDLYKTNRSTVYDYLLNIVISTKINKQFMENLNEKFRKKFMSRLFEIIEEHLKRSS